MSGNEKKVNSDNQWLVAFIIGLMVAGCIWWFVASISGNEEDLAEDITSCAQECAMDMDQCTFFSIVYNSDREAFIPNDDYEMCSLELESCIDSCSS